VNIQKKNDGSTHFYVGPRASHSHTIIDSSGRLVYDRGVGPNGQHVVFIDDKGRGMFPRSVTPTIPPATLPRKP
jgi:hypothetical protein